MKKALKYFIFFTFSMFVSFVMTAQELPETPRDPSVKNGVLPNGMSFYLVENPTTDNIADFALIQRTGLNDLGDQAKALARDGLTELPRLKASPQSFLASHGVAPNKNGFVSVSENATLYHFDNIILTETAIDSVLLVLMDIADRGTHREETVWSWYTPEDQAIIVSGDIDAKVFESKLKMLSYMTPAREARKRDEYVWQEQNNEIVCEVQHGLSGQIVTISATWTSPRIQKEYLSTVQPAIYSMFVNELGLLAKERIIQRARVEELPVANVSYEHVSSLRTVGEEKFNITLSVFPEHVADAVLILAQTMSALDNGTATVHEFEMVKRRYLTDLEKRAGQLIRSNNDYVEYCASAFLYGAPLSSSKEIYPFLKYRSIGLDTELMHFNNIASALLDKERNLTLNCITPEGFGFTDFQLKQMFLAAWDSDNLDFQCIQAQDSLFSAPVSEPIKLKRVKKDPMSGGSVWTFENGFQVVYKRQSTGHRMYYALALNGGYGNIRGLSQGEGAYVSDYLTLSNVSCSPSRDFNFALESKGVTLTPKVNISNTVIEGSAPESELDMMMQSLLAFVNERDYDEDAFRYYKSCLAVEREMMKGTVHDRTVAIDSLMCPGYAYSSIKTTCEISDDFPEKVEAFWNHQCGKTNDGVLVLIGNVEETKLRKFLQGYIGEFKTTDRAYPRLNVNYQPASGAIAYNFKGEVNSVDMALSLRLPLTAENYMASTIAASVLKQMISKAISGTGMHLRLAHDFRIYPQERFNMLITLEEADPQGFAQDVQLTGASEALAVLRKVLSDLPEAEISDSELVKHKDVLKGHLGLKISDPQYWLHALVMRYLDGKDFTTSYESRIEAVDAEKVKNILTSLSTTSRIEYIIEN